MEYRIAGVMGGSGSGVNGRFTAFSSEVDAGSREENALKQQPGASVLIQSEPKLQAPTASRCRRWAGGRDRKP
jgi:hypothetical protein